MICLVTSYAMNMWAFSCGDRFEEPKLPEAPREGALARRGTGAQAGPQGERPTEVGGIDLPDRFRTRIRNRSPSRPRRTATSPVNGYVPCVPLIAARRDPAR